MKIAVSSTGTDLGSPIDPRFGRCAYFLIVETDDMSFEACNNENIALGGGAGIQSAQFVSSKGAKVVLTGSCGPNAVQTLAAAGIELFVGRTGTVKEAIEAYKNGALRPTDQANVPDHYGMGQTGQTAQPSSQNITGGQGMGGGGGRGMGGGGGRGMGGGGGMGMGRGMGMASGQGMPAWQEKDATDASDLSGTEDLNLLKQQAADLKKQMEGLESKIEKLKEKK